MKTTKILAIGCSVLVLSGLVFSSALAGNGWHGTKARIAVGGGSATIRMWERGADVVLTYEQDGDVKQHNECRAGVLTQWDVADDSAVIHAEMAAADCARIASDALRGAGRLAKSSYKASGSVTSADGRKHTRYVATDALGTEIVVDDATGLPVSVAADGQVATYAYEPIDSETPPAIELKPSTYVEEYRAVGAPELAAAFKAAEVPARVGAFRLSRTFTYDSGPTTGRAYYAIWRDQSGRELQVVLNTGVPSADTPYAFTNDGQQVVFRISEGDTWLQVFAPDLPSLRATVAAVRPGLVGRLEQEVAHPASADWKGIKVDS